MGYENFRVLDRNNERGFAPVFFLIILLLLVVLPTWFISVNEVTVKNQLALHTRTETQDRVDNYVAAVFGSLQGVYACSANLKSMNLMNQPVSKLDEIVFRPKIVNDNDANDASDGKVSNIDALELVKNEFLKDIEISSSVLRPCAKDDPLCPKVSGAGRALYKWEISFDNTGMKKARVSDPVMAGVAVGTASTIVKRAGTPSLKRTLLVNVGVDTASRVLGCSLSMKRSNELMEDKVCQVLGAGDGATRHNSGANEYQMGASPQLIAEPGCK